MLVGVQSCPVFVIPWTVAHQAPLSMGLSRQEYWSGFPIPPPGHLPDPEIETTAPVSPYCRWILHHYATWEAPICLVICK